MSLLSVMKDVARQLGLSEPSTVVSSTDPTTVQLLSLLQKDLQEEIKAAHVWPQLIRVHSFTLATDTAAYALPADFDSFQYETHWDQSNNWLLDGPVSPTEWNLRKYGTLTTAPRLRFRVQGFADDELYLHPTPGSGDSGNTVSFEYLSRTWIRPKSWVTATAFAASSYCWNDGNIYQTASGGTTGATAPTHTTGSASDGTVTWTFVAHPYEEFVADTDEFIIPEQVIRTGLIYFWRETHGLDTPYFRDKFERAMRSFVVKKRGARSFNLTGKRLMSARGPFQSFGDV